MGTELPEWLKSKYSILQNKFGTREFSYEQATRILEENKDDKKTVANVLSELEKAGFIEMKSGSSNNKAIYKLKPREEWKEIFSVGQKVTRNTIESILKKAADLIRTRVDYKFILILLFYKRISDKWELEYEKEYRKALADGLSEEKAREEARNYRFHTFDLPEEFLWDNIRKDVDKLPESFSQALKALGERNKVLKDVVDRTDFIQFTTSTENAEILRQLVELFSEKKLQHVSPDILGDAYEWVLRYFAPTKAKEGEVYTPREVIKLLVEMLDPEPGESVYDPCCGSGGMLITSYNHVKEEHGEEEVRRLFLYGEEVNPMTYALCKMNLYIHDIIDVNIQMGDTLLYPKFLEHNSLKKFDVVIANPPWNQDGYGKDTLKKADFWKQRFKHGPSPNQSADWVWMQHMTMSAKKANGRVGVVIDNGCLFRGGKEKRIRAKVLEQDLIECVILLPEKLFYNTGAPGAIIVFNRKKPKERKGKVLFINASDEYEQHPDVRKLSRLGEENISKIAEVYKEFNDMKGFAKAVSLDRIKENDRNLNVPLYVFPSVETEEIDLNREWEGLEEIEEELGKLKERIKGFLKEVDK